MSLRDHLLAAQTASSPAAAEILQQHNAGQAGQGHHIDPQISPSPYGSSPPGPTTLPQDPDVKKGRRELSTTKRAAQNRAAQRAFRQRKEQYISSLRTEVKNYEELSASYKSLESENLVLREYIITLQSRLLESGHSEFPPAPVDLSRPSPRVTAAAEAAAAAAAAAEQSHDNDGNSMSVEEQLQAAAAAAAHHASEIGQNQRRQQQRQEQEQRERQGQHGQDVDVELDPKMDTSTMYLDGEMGGEGGNAGNANH